LAPRSSFAGDDHAPGVRGGGARGVQRPLGPASSREGAGATCAGATAALDIMVAPALAAGAGLRAAVTVLQAMAPSTVPPSQPAAKIPASDTVDWSFPHLQRAPS